MGEDKILKRHKGYFLALLDDHDIREKIYSIAEKKPSLPDTADLQKLQNALAEEHDHVSQLETDIESRETELSNLRTKYQDLQNSFTEKERQNRDLQTSLSEAHGKIEKLQTDLEKQECEISALREKYTDVEAETHSYQTTYGTLETAFSQFHNLSGDIQESFQTIVNGASPIAFLLSGSNRENIRLFFEKVCMEWEKYSDNTLQVLNEIFDYLFEQFRINNPEYHRIETVREEEFRMEKHTRTAGSPPVGKVKRIIISGYTNESGNKKVKSYVEIG